MALKLLILSTLFYVALGQPKYYSCNERSVLLLLKKHAYNFSIEILDRVAQNNNAHFVFSPLSTWLQMSAVAEGASGRTYRELLEVTQHHQKRCFKMKLRQLLHEHTKGINEEYRRENLIIIDEYMGVKQAYIDNVLLFYTAKVLLKNFDYYEESADEVNELIANSTNNVIDLSVYMNDFNKTYVLLSDNLYYKSAWKYPFDVAFTKKESFKSNTGDHLGDVNMMSYTGYLNVTNLEIINSRVLEIPCLSNFSMLIFMPLTIDWIGDTFYNMGATNLMAIFHKFEAEGEKLVHVKLPRFNITSTVDNLAELLYDMGVKSLFNPTLSELPNISDYKPLFVSLITQIADIEVTEKGVRASAESMSYTRINETAEKVEFFADNPFAFMIVERETQFILFAGTYTKPSVF